MNVLIAKSVIEVLLVASLTVGFFFIVFPPHFHGWGEATPHAIEGWVVNQHDASRRVEIQLFIDDRFVATSTANRSRPDIVTVGQASDQWHGYSFEIPSLSEGPHTARVYAIHSSGGGATKTLQLVGDSILFTIDANGAAHWAPASKKSWLNDR